MNFEKGQSHILIPVDFNEKLTSVINHGVALADELNWPIKLLHVISNEVPALVDAHSESSWLNNPPGDLLEERKKQAETKLRVLANRISKKSNVECKGICTNGFVDIEIMEHSKKGAGLIVMGTPGYNSIIGQLLGSRSAKIVNHTDVPIFLVPNGAGYLPVRNIVSAVSYQYPGDEKDRWFLNFANKLGAKIHFVRVISKETDGDKLRLKEFKKKIIQTLNIATNNRFKLFISKTVDRGIRQYSQQNFGDAIAVKRSADSSWKDLLSLNISHEMSRNSTVPVLIY